VFSACALLWEHHLGGPRGNAADQPLSPNCLMLGRSAFGSHGLGTCLYRYPWPDRLVRASTCFKCTVGFFFANSHGRMSFAVHGGTLGAHSFFVLFFERGMSSFARSWRPAAGYISTPAHSSQLVRSFLGERGGVSVTVQAPAQG